MLAPSNHILVPTDLFALSQRAVRSAGALAEILDAPLHLLHVLSPVEQAYNSAGKLVSRATRSLVRLKQNDYGRLARLGLDGLPDQPRY